VTPADNRGVARGFCRLNHHAEVIPDWLVDEFATTSTAAQCRAQIAIIPYSCYGEAREATLRGFAKAMG